MKIHFKVIVLLVFFITGGQVQAKDQLIKLEGIKIKADNEAPQVMYIIPWQNPEGAERLYTPITGAEVERLKPLDPYTFELEIGLHEQWKNSDKMTIDLVSD